MNHTDYQNRLDEILTKLENAVVQDTAQRMSGQGGKMSPKHHHTIAKQALTKLTEEVVDEVIGKDEPLPEKTFQGDDNIADYFCSECYFAVDTCSHETENDLRSDQRTTKTKLLKGEL